MAKPNASAYSYQTADLYLHLIIIKIVVLNKKNVSHLGKLGLQINYRDIFFENLMLQFGLLGKDTMLNGL